MSEDKITIKYQTQKHSCRCCEQRLDKPETSGLREFDFYLDNIKEWTDWSYYVIEQEQLKDSVIEYIEDTICFFAADSEDEILLQEGDLERFIQYILTKFKK